MTVCKSCASYGEVVRPVRSGERREKSGGKQSGEERSGRLAPPSSRAPPLAASGERLLIITEGFAGRIKEARERLGLKQEELAKRLRLKESQLHKYETGSQTPDLETARSLERALRITLVEEHEDGGFAAPGEGGAGGPLTIGDLLKKR